MLKDTSWSITSRPVYQTIATHQSHENPSSHSRIFLPRNHRRHHPPKAVEGGSELVFQGFSKVWAENRCHIAEKTASGVSTATCCHSLPGFGEKWTSKISGSSWSLASSANSSSQSLGVTPLAGDWKWPTIQQDPLDVQSCDYKMHPHHHHWSSLYFRCIMRGHMMISQDI